MATVLHKFLREERGSATADWAVVFLAVMFFILTIIEITLAFYISVAAQKSAQLAARMVATRDPIHAEVPLENTINYANGVFGDACFQPGGNDACVAPNDTAWVCEGAALSTDCDAVGWQLLLAEMTRIYPMLDTTAVSVHYLYRRLGYAGGPFVPEIQVRISRRPMPIRMLTWLGALDLRSVQASAIGEDLDSSN